jgi:hypothetical protein
MALHFGNEGNNIAIIKDNPNYKNQMVSVSADKMENQFKSLKLNNGYFQPIANYNAERTVGYCVGSSGSGKSRFICNWVLEYKKKYKKNPIYLFSSLDEDVSLNPIKPLRVILDDVFLNETINLKDFENSCVIFDDIDTIANKKIKDKVYTIMNQMLNTGRHHNISVWCVNHSPTGNKTETKTILNEAHQIVFFCANYSRQLQYLLENYCGIDRKQFKYINSLDSRWTCFNKHYPQSIITDKHCIMMSELNNK